INKTSNQDDGAVAERFDTRIPPSLCEICGLVIVPIASLACRTRSEDSNSCRTVVVAVCGIKGACCAINRTRRSYGLIAAKSRPRTVGKMHPGGAEGVCHQ